MPPLGTMLMIKRQKIEKYTQLFMTKANCWMHRVKNSEDTLEFVNLVLDVKFLQQFLSIM